jgi:transketolase
MSSIQELKQVSKSIRKNILNMAFTAGSSSAHIGGALSIADIMTVLFATKIKYLKGDPYFEGRDRFILSKGHACLAYYASLFENNFLNEKDLLSFEKDGSDLLGHPVRNMEKGIEFSTGSLGMGLSLGIGVALSLKKKKLSNHIYIVLGDGECNEGSVWEAAMCASHYKLNNITVIVDNNNFQQTGSNDQIMSLGDLSLKWKSFNWTTSIIDGHDLNQINLAFEKNLSDYPNVIIAKTIKGKGVSMFENNNSWHHAVVTKKIYDEAILEIERKNGN